MQFVGEEGNHTTVPFDRPINATSNNIFIFTSQISVYIAATGARNKTVLAIIKFEREQPSVNNHLYSWQIIRD